MRPDEILLDDEGPFSRVPRQGATYVAQRSASDGSWHSTLGQWVIYIEIAHAHVEMCTLENDVLRLTRNNGAAVGLQNSCSLFCDCI